MKATGTKEIIEATAIQRESASGLSRKFSDLYQYAGDGMMIGLMEAGVARGTALTLVNDATDALLAASRQYNDVEAALARVASTLEAVERAHAQREGRKPDTRFVIN